MMVKKEITTHEISYDGGETFKPVQETDTIIKRPKSKSSANFDLLLRNQKVLIETFLSMRELTGCPTLAKLKGGLEEINKIMESE
jgi:hypothetical protein